MSENEVCELIKKGLEELGYEGLYADHTVTVTTWCGRERHDDEPDFVVYVKFRGLKEPFCIIEAKSPDERIDLEEYVNQARSYALWLKGTILPITPYFIIFNGNEAAIYTTITANRVKYGRSLKDVMPNHNDAKARIQEFLDLLIGIAQGGSNCP